MKSNIISLFFLLLLITTWFSSCNKNDLIQEYKYISTIDWDTIKISKNWNKFSVRMIWIDAPEISKIRKWYAECFWKESKEYLQNIIWKNDYISVEIDQSQWKQDKYWRILWYILIDNINIIIGWSPWAIFNFTKNLFLHIFN